MSEKSIRHIAKKVREFRDDRRLTQKQLADKSGLSTNYISRIERADVTISIDTLEKLAKALKVNSSDILHF